MAESLRFTVPAECGGMAAKWFLKSRCGLSTRMITRLKREKDGILMDGKILRTVDKVDAGASVVISLPEEDGSFVEPREGVLNIVYEDKHLLVVARQVMLSLLEILLAKEAKDRIISQWKTPRLS